ncbi:MAG: hypothetical protein CMQ51_01560 [Gammaproteobacteria bacterium]|nr:hypothetical protein [Gammaproteobacteria bacterium]
MFLKRLCMSNKTRLSLATIFIIGLLCISLLLPDQEGSFSDKSVKNIILREYVDKIDEDQVSLNLELGTLDGLDNYSKFLIPSKHEDFLQEIELNSSHESVFGKYLPNDIGYIRILYFSNQTCLQLTDIVKALEKDSKRPLKGFILDLRNNPGGSLSSAIEISDAFLDDGTIVITRGRTSDSRSLVRARIGDVIKGKPLVVLSNLGTASSAEVVVAALKENKRAKVFGQRTQGKGTVQTLYPLIDGSALYLTSAFLVSPLGKKIDSIGVQPNIVYRAKMPQVQYMLSSDNIYDDTLLIEAINVF